MKRYCQLSAVLTSALLIAWAVLASPVSAQTNPPGTINFVVAYSPGGTGDVVARIVAEKLQAALGQNVVVENRPGASGAIAARGVVGAAPDGLTLLVGQTGEMAINQHIIKNLPYDPAKDLQPVALAAVVPLALVVPKTAPYSDISGFIKALPSSKNMSFASAGSGTPGFFAGELLKLKTKGAMTHVPYKGAGPALNDLLGGHVDMYFPGFPAVTSHLKSGLLKLLAVSSAKRSQAAPDIPTMNEALGGTDFDFTLWVGFFAPRDTPKEVVARLNKEINAVLAQPEVKAKLLQNGSDSNPMSQAEFAAFVKAESDKYARIVKAVGVTPE